MSKLPINLTTPHGHRVEAQVDDENFKVDTASVIVQGTEQRLPLSQETIHHLEDLVRNKQLYFEAVSNLGRVFSEMPSALRDLALSKPSHPGVAPYFRNEIDPHTQVVEQAKVNDEQLKLRIGTDVDHLVEKPGHGLAANLRGKDDGSRSV